MMMLKKIIATIVAATVGAGVAQAGPTENLKAAEAFLAVNAKKPGVKTTASGLQYKVLLQGKGAKPTPVNSVSVKYKGYFASGKIFDQSQDPISFGVSQVVPGWTEALQLMPAGSKYRLWLHPKIGYGGRETGPIAPNSLLVFDVELLSIAK
jgi:FKBP-type peptidyl-prolyl cis-trans isomerase FkpA